MRVSRPPAARRVAVRPEGAGRRAPSPAASPSGERPGPHARYLEPVAGSAPVSDEPPGGPGAR